MIVLKRDVFVNNGEIMKDDTVEVDFFNFYNEKKNKENIFYVKGEEKSHIFIKDNDIIEAHISIYNNCDKDIKSLNLKIMKDRIFKIVSTSIMDNEKGESYMMDEDDGMFHLGSLPYKGAIKVNVYIVADFSSMNTSILKKNVYILRAKGCHSDEVISFRQAVVNIRNVSDRSTIYIENIGTERVDNVIYKHRVSDNASLPYIEYNFINFKGTAYIEKINGIIFFQISSLEPSTADVKKYIELTIVDDKKKIDEINHKKNSESFKGAAMNIK